MPIYRKGDSQFGLEEAAKQDFHNRLANVNVKDDAKSARINGITVGSTDMKVSEIKGDFPVSGSGITAGKEQRRLRAREKSRVRGKGY